jgi:predicted Zn-ribbon and HTH transcriptional regulator
MLAADDHQTPALSQLKPKLELADVFRLYGCAYRNSHRLPLTLLKVMRAIENCRPAALGGHIQQCDQCGYQRQAYNSCRNRHCPKCQSQAKARWLEDRKSDLLPVGYFHMVFTLPHELNPLVLSNKKALFDLLFKAVSETGKVSFSYRDRKREKKLRRMTLSAEEFIRRFLLHVLPEWFVRIRHYGILANRTKKEEVACCSRLLAEEGGPGLVERKSSRESMEETAVIELSVCPECKEGRMVKIGELATEVVKGVETGNSQGPRMDSW